MKKLVFATNNEHKLKEVNSILGNSYNIIGLKEIGCCEDIAETSHTLEGNASLKSHYVKQHYHLDCFADDTGLEIEALKGKPGVFSARYAGDEQDAEANIIKVLHELKGKTNRKARFRTVISLIIDDQEYFFEGIINGMIIELKRGRDGFGYDPIFIPDGYDKTFAEMDLKQKNEISHRALAIKKLIDFLSKKA